MGWGYGVNRDGREVGYSVEAICDLDGCNEKIDRGLYGVCGGMHDGGEFGCGKYFCGDHIILGVGLPDQLCEECAASYQAENPEEYAAAIAEWDARVVASRDKQAK